MDGDSLLRARPAQSLAPAQERWHVAQCLSSSSGAQGGEPGLWGGAWPGIPTRGRGRPFHRTSGLLHRLTRGQLWLTRPVWSPAAPRTALDSSSRFDTWGEFQDDRESRSRDVTGVSGIGGRVIWRPDQKAVYSALKEGTWSVLSDPG